MAKGRKTGGRQPGTPNKATAATRAEIAQQADPIAFLAQVMRGEPIESAAVAGGEKLPPLVPTIEQRMAAARVLADKLVPSAKSRPVRLDLPTIVTAADVLEAHRVVLAAMGRGEITPDEAEKIGGLLDARRKAIETSELQRQLDELYAMVKGVLK